jgi:hypothetical protein
MDKNYNKNQATFFKEEVENLMKRYGKMTVYETIGALEVVKQNLLDRLGKMPPPPPQPIDLGDGVPYNPPNM